MDVPLFLRGVPGIGVPPIMRKSGVRLFVYPEQFFSSINSEGRKNGLGNNQVSG